MARLHERAEGVITLTGSHGEAREISTLNGRAFAHEVTLFAQSHATPEGLAVADIVAFGRHPHRRGFAGLSETDDEAIAWAMPLTGTTSMSRKAAGELSGEELQRVWLAVCLAQQTNVVLLDEPTNHLDLRYQVETLDLVHDVAGENRLAIGIVLHDLNQAAALADRLVLMKHGRVHAAGTPAEVLTAENLFRSMRSPCRSARTSVPKCCVSNRWPPPAEFDHLFFSQKHSITRENLCLHSRVTQSLRWPP